MQVLSGRECIDERTVPGEVRHDPHLDLRVVDRHQRLEARTHDEGLADLAAFLGADRDVLQVGILARQPTRRCHELVEGGVDAAGVVNHRDQGVDNRLQPRHVTVAEQMSDQRMLRLCRQPDQ